MKVKNTNITLIDCLTNRSVALRTPEQKKATQSSVYYQHNNYTRKQIPLATICQETLLKGYHLVPGEFVNTQGKGIRTSDNWKSQQLFLVEFDDLSEKTIDEFIAARPFIKENAWMVTESIRSRFNDPDDDTCNGQLRLRVVLCMPRPVTSKDERQWIYDALSKELPDCDDGAANSITNGGLGNANAAHVKVRKIVDEEWFNQALKNGQKKKAEADRRKKQRKRKKRTTPAAHHREAQLPLIALAKTDPTPFLESINLSFKSNSGHYHHFGRPDKHNDTALSVWKSDTGNWQISVFAQSIPTPVTAKAIPFARFYCYHEFNEDIENLQPDTHAWKNINTHLAARGYGTWIPEKDFKARYTQDHTPEQKQRIQRIIDQAPHTESIQRPSYPYFTPEQKIVAEEILNIPADAGWNGEIPYWTTKYEYLHRLLPNKFAMNGQPTEVEKRRIWSTLVGQCPRCNGDTVMSIDRFDLTAKRYCDKCHKDYVIGSYLELQLNRKLPNSIISDYQGYLADDPEFQNFRLWQPGQLTHLGAAMGTGKTTELVKIARILAEAGLGKVIIAVPRISLARFLAHLFREKDGKKAWGVWHEGADRNDRFIGEIGAFVCLPSLPKAIAAAGDCPIHIAIDEIDFAYSLTTLAIEQATAIKKCLKKHLEETGLVISGQTESTLALEALIEELEPETSQGFYNTAPPATGRVVLHKIKNEEGKQNALLAAVVERIKERLAKGKTPYVFCSSRRDADIIAAYFKEHNPLVYNAYTKLFRDCEQLLKEQKLPEGYGLFIATSAADVGLSIYDKNAHTVIAAGLNHGTRNLKSILQMTQRVRNRNDIDIYFTDYNFSLPVAPTENEITALEHEKLKQVFNPEAYISTGAIKNIARAKALQTLADTQPETFIRYHLGTIANMQISEASVIPPHPSHIEWIQKTRKELTDTEREEVTKIVVDIFKNKNLKTASQIRRTHTMRIEYRMAHERAAQIALALGNTEEIDTETDTNINQLSDTDTQLAIKIAQAGINPEALIKHLRGYLATHDTDFVKEQLISELLNATQKQIEDGLGKEIHTIRYDIGTGEILTALLNTLQGKVWTEDTLAQAVMNTLTENGLLEKLQTGMLGTREYRRARFLHCTTNEHILNWTKHFIAEWYPARIAKRGEKYAIAYTKHYQLQKETVQTYLQANGHEKDQTHTEIQIISLPSRIKKMKDKACKMRKAKMTIKSIAEKLKKPEGTIKRWCKDIVIRTPKTDPKLQSHMGHSYPNTTHNWNKTRSCDFPHEPLLRHKILDVIHPKIETTTAEIIDKVDGHPTAIKNELKRLLTKNEIVKVKHGVYQLPQCSIAHLIETETEHETAQAVSDTLSKTPKPRPPHPSQKPKPQDTETEKPPPANDLTIPPVRELQDPASDDTVLTSECLLYRDEVRQSILNGYPDMSETARERLIQTTEPLIREWIQGVKKRLSNVKVFVSKLTKTPITNTHVADAAACAIAGLLKRRTQKEKIVNTAKLNEKHLLGKTFEKPIVLVTYQGNVAIQEKVKVRTYDLLIDGKQINKLEVMFAFPLNQFEQIKESILLKQDIAKKKLKSITRPKDRPKVATCEQYKAGNNKSVNITLRTGHTLTGKQVAATQYNLILNICGQDVLVYKHGILQYQITQE